MLELIHSCDIKRSVIVGTNGRTQMQLLYKSVPCLVLPMNHNTAIKNKFEVSRAHDIYFDDGQDIRPADQIVYNGDTYVVKVAQAFAVPLVGHVRTMCEQEIS